MNKVQLVIETDVQSGTAALKRFGADADEAFKRVRGGADTFGRGLRETVQPLQVMTDSVVSRLNPALSGAVSQFSGAARAAASLPVALGVATVAITAGSIALGLYLDRLKDSQEFQASFNMAARRGDLGTLQGMYNDVAGKIELYNVQQRQATQEITGFMSALQVIVAFWQMKLGPSLDEMTAKLEKLKPTIGLFALREGGVQAGALDARFTQIRQQDLGLQFQQRLSLNPRASSLDWLTERMIAEVRQRSKFEVEAAREAMKKAIDIAVTEEQRVVAKELFDRSTRNIGEQERLQIAALREDRRRANVAVTERLFGGALDRGDFSMGEIPTASQQEIDMAAAQAGARAAEEFWKQFEATLANETRLWEGFEAGMVATTPELLDAAALGRSRRPDAMLQLEDALRQVNDQAAIFGVNFDKNAATLAAVQSAITELIAQGIDPMDTRLQGLKVRFEDLTAQSQVSQTLEQMERDLLEATFRARSLDEALAAIGQTLMRSLSEAIIRQTLKPLNDELAALIIQLAKLGLTTVVGWFGPTTPSTAGSPGINGPVGAFPAAEGAYVKARPGGHLMLVAEDGKDEIISPIDKLGRLGGNVYVNVTNNAAPEVGVSVRESRGPGDDRFIEIAVDRAVNQMRSNGKLDRIMRADYGIQRQGTRR